MNVCDNVRQAYLSRAGYRDKEGGINWAEWARIHPDLNEILNEAAKAAENVE